MYILTIDGKEKDGAYSVQNGEGDHVLYLFEEKDDADRYLMLLESNDYPDRLEVMEVDPDIVAVNCTKFGYQYTVVTANDFVIPPV